MNHFRRTVVIASLALAGVCAFGQNESENWQRDLLQWRQHHATVLSAADGWLTVVALDWLKPGRNTLGTTEQDSIRLPGKDSQHYGILDVETGVVRLLAPEGGFPSTLYVDGHDAQETTLVLEGKHPTTFTSGSLTFFVIQRADKLAVRVRDSQAEERLGFHGLKWYAPDTRFKVEAEWIPFPDLKKVNIQNAVGLTTQGFVPGVAKFSFQGQEFTLEPFVSDANAKGLMFVIRDATSGKTTYPASRFLYTALPDHGLAAKGKVVLDFNRLENPPCAFTEFATCPLPPQTNRLSIALEAGEQRYK